MESLGVVWLCTDRHRQRNRNRVVLLYPRPVVRESCARCRFFDDTDSLTRETHDATAHLLARFFCAHRLLLSSASLGRDASTTPTRLPKTANTALTESMRSVGLPFSRSTM